MYLSKPMAYVYFVKNLTTGQFYYGSRYQNVKRKTQPEDDLWIVYFTSSKSIKQLRREYGDNDFVYDVIFRSSDFNECFMFEQYLIQHNIKNRLCINKAFKGSSQTMVYRHYGKGFDISEEARKKCGDKWRGKKVPSDLIAKRVASWKEHHPRTDEWNSKIKDGVKRSYENPSPAMQTKYTKIAEKNKLWVWITNGVETARIKKADLEITLLQRTGWWQGMTRRLKQEHHNDQHH